MSRRKQVKPIRFNFEKNKTTTKVTTNELEIIDLQSKIKSNNLINNEPAIKKIKINTKMDYTINKDNKNFNFLPDVNCESLGCPPSTSKYNHKIKNISNLKNLNNFENSINSNKSKSINLLNYNLTNLINLSDSTQTEIKQQNFSTTNLNQKNFNCNNLLTDSLIKNKSNFSNTTNYPTFYTNIIQNNKELTKIDENILLNDKKSIKFSSSTLKKDNELIKSIKDPLLSLNCQVNNLEKTLVKTNSINKLNNRLISNNPVSPKLKQNDSKKLTINKFQLLNNKNDNKSIRMESRLASNINNNKQLQIKTNATSNKSISCSNPLNKLFEFVANLDPPNIKITKNFDNSNSICELKVKKDNNELKHWKNSVSDNIIYNNNNKNNNNNNNNNQSDQNKTSSHCDILKCTMCAKRCKSLEELAEHKQNAGHINFSIPRTVQWPSTKVNHKNNNNFLSLNNISYTNLIQPTNIIDNCSLLMSIIAKASSPTLQTQFLKVNQQNANKKQSVSNAIGRRGHFGFQCTICGFISMDTPVAVHMTTAHSFKNPVEWKEAVVLIPVHK